MAEIHGEEGAASIVYECVVGHVIPSQELEEATEIAVLDEGARVRICSRHGAPIATTCLRSNSRDL